MAQQGGRQGVVHGTVAAGYEAVRGEFEAAVASEPADHSAQLAAYVHGERVVDLWTGPDTDGDTLFAVYSSTKGAAFLATALLLQDGVLDPDRAVADYWPEFGAAGKAGVTLRQLLSHQAGVIGLADGRFSTAELADDAVLAARLAGQPPFWQPGAAFGYHALVIGALVGEVVRRATGQRLAEVYEERIRAPYEIDLFLGLPEEHEHRFRTSLPMQPTPRQQAALDALPRGPHSLASIAFNRPSDLVEWPNHRKVRALGQASGGGVGSARGLARMYAAAGSDVDGLPPLLKPETLAEVARAHSVGRDLVTGIHQAFALGFQAICHTQYPYLGAGTFGHDGAAGSQAFADPRDGFSYAYTRRRHAFPGGPAPENERLVRAVHRAVTGAV